VKINVRDLYAAGLSRTAVDSLVALSKLAQSAEASADAANTAAAAAQAQADVALVTASNASGSSSYWLSSPARYVFTSDPTGSFAGGDPHIDITATLYDQDAVQISQRVLRGTMTSGTGNIAVTSISTSGLTNSFTLSGDGTTSVSATIQATLGDGSVSATSVSWASVNISVPGGILF